ncbi:MAG: class I SAM-dependent methyltransferase, partial [Anaerovoracaceae bacterium]
MADKQQRTLEYYENNAEVFIAGTVDSDVSGLYPHFQQHLQPGQSILDLGCGAGRDSKYFLEQGFSVTAVDGSPTLCQYASKLTGITVSCLRFEDLDQESCFHGIWACASLLHVAKKEMPAIIRKVNRALISQG